MGKLNIHRVTVLPGTLAAESMYIVNPGGEDTYMEIYVTGNTNSVVRRVPTITDIQSLVSGAPLVVADITARDALSLAGNGNVFVIVLDASDDASVDSGAAMYLFNDDGDTFTKLTEYESLDLIVDWADITNKPSSSAAAIDAAVANAHTHSNSTELAKIGESGGRFQYDGAFIDDWASADW